MNVVISLRALVFVMCVQALLLGAATFLAWSYISASGPFEGTLWHFGQYGAVFVVVLAFIGLALASFYTVLSSTRPESHHRDFV